MLEALREQLSEYAKKIAASGLVVGPGGNISAVLEGTMLISPSGFDLAEIEPAQWCEIDIATGAASPDALRPSSEVLMHLAAYRVRPDAAALIHTHPAHCIALGIVTTELPMLFPDQAALVGDIAFVDYVVPTTEKLANAVAATITQAATLLLGNHGLVTIGRNLREAYYRTLITEESAKIYLLARAVCEPKRLTPEEVLEIQNLDSEAYRVALLRQQNQ